MCNIDICRNRAFNSQKHLPFLHPNFLAPRGYLHGSTALQCLRRTAMIISNGPKKLAWFNLHHHWALHSRLFETLPPIYLWLRHVVVAASMTPQLNQCWNAFWLADSMVLSCCLQVNSACWDLVSSGVMLWMYYSRWLLLTINCAQHLKDDFHVTTSIPWTPKISVTAKAPFFVDKQEPNHGPWVHLGSMCPCEHSNHCAIMLATIV